MRQEENLRLLSLPKISNENYKMKKGFTLLELIIVVTIVLTLASIAISQTSGVQQLIQFNNSFQQIMFFTSRARSLSVTGAEAINNTAAELLGVNFPSAMEADLIASDSDPAVTQSELVESYSLPSKVLVALSGSTLATCSFPAKIIFEKETANIRFFCGENEQGPVEAQDKFLTIRLCQVQDSSEQNCPQAGSSSIIRERQFTIHRASGIPQL